MAIVGFCGLMGSGKSYSVVQQVIIPALASGRHIVTNIPLTDAIYDEPSFNPVVTSFEINKDFKREEFFKEENLHKGAIYVIDEVQKIWRQGMKATQFSTAEIEFLTESRHMVGENGFTTEIVVITQDFSQTASYLRNLINQTYRAVKLSSAGLSNHFRLDIYNGCVTGQRPPSSSFLYSVHGKYLKEVYKYYKTNTRNDTNYAKGLEKIAVNKTIWQSPLVKFGIPFGIAFILFSFYYLSSLYSSYTSNDESDINSTATTTTATTTTTDNVNSEVSNSIDFDFENRPFNFSSVFRISGEIKKGRYHVVYITDNEYTYPFPYYGSCQDLPYLGLVCDFFGHVVSYNSGKIVINSEEENVGVEDVTPSFLQ